MCKNVSEKQPGEKEKDWKIVKIYEFKFRLSSPENVFKAEDLCINKKSYCNLLLDSKQLEKNFGPGVKWRIEKLSWNVPE